MLLRWKRDSGISVLSGRIDGYSGAHKSYRIVLRNIRFFNSPKLASIL